MLIVLHIYGPRYGATEARVGLSLVRSTVHDGPFRAVCLQLWTLCLSPFLCKLHIQFTLKALKALKAHLLFALTHQISRSTSPPLYRNQLTYRTGIAMVLLHDVQASNSSLASALPGLVAVFVGATNGIGEFTLKQFAKHASKPRVYFTGRSQEAGDRISAECTELNSKGKFIFIKADTSLIRNVDDVCRDIKSKEQSINILFLSAGTLIEGTSMVVIHLTIGDTAANLNIYRDFRRA
jgi:hypothetical protein